MQRRTVLAGCGVLAGGLAGCLGADYEQCDGAVKFSALPEAAREEVSTAREDGPYETDGDLTLAAVLDVDEGRLVREYLYGSNFVRHYDVAVETDGDVTRLRVEETIPETDPPTLFNGTDAPQSVDVWLEYAVPDPLDERDREPEVRVDETMTVPAGESVALEGSGEYRNGTYRARFTVPELKIEAEELTWSVDISHSQADVLFDADGITYERRVADIGYCDPT